MAKQHSWEKKLKEGQGVERQVKSFLKERGIEVTEATRDEQRRGIDFRIKR